MRRRCRELLDRQHRDLVQRHRAVARQAAMLGRDLAGLVGEPPWRIGQDGGEAPATHEVQQVVTRVGAPGTPTHIACRHRSRAPRPVSFSLCSFDYYTRVALAESAVVLSSTSICA